MTNLGYTPEEPIAAIATALAPSAIGIVRGTGKNCIELFSKIFSRPEAVKKAPGNTLVYGWIVDPSAEGEESKVDEVMVAVYRGPKSFTGEDMVEVNCHGGLSIVQKILKLFFEAGFRQSQKGEWTFRSYINGKTDLTRAEAIREIIDSKTDAARGHAAGRLAGNLYSEIDSVKQLIIDSLAAIEVEIEYPEDEENISDTFDSSKLEQALGRLKSLADSWKSEKLYQDGARVVLCGKTNAGKSSLFNSFLKEERAIVSDIEGTTRDYLESYANFDGIPVRLFDTAGLRETQDKIEGIGVERAKDLSLEADLVMYLVDSARGLSQEDREFISSRKDLPMIVVWNKCDSQSTIAAEPIDNIPHVSISAKKGIGIGELCSKAKEILSRGKEENNSRIGLGSQRQKECVQEAVECVSHALEIAHDGEYGLDAVVQDLEDSLDSLGELTGQVCPDDILSSVFANFCVGK